MAKINFTQEEFEVVSRQVKRLLSHKEKSQARQLRRKEEDYKVLKSLDRKLHAPETDLKLDRKDLRGVQSLANISKGILISSIIPGYEQRIKDSTDMMKKEKLSGYLDKAKQTLATYENVLKRVEKLL